MWKPSEVVENHRRRAVLVWSVLVLAIAAYAGWLLYKATEKAKTPDTSFVLSNEVYRYPDIWICPYNQYGCDSQELELECINSAWMTEAGPPDAVFYPRERMDKLNQDTTEQLQIEAIARDTGEEGRGLCVEFKTSAATAFLGKQRDASEYLDYILLDMYWYPGGETGNSTTCVPDGQAWTSHREWVYAFLVDSEDDSMASTGIQLSYSCINEASDSHTFSQIGIGLSNQDKFNSDGIKSYTAESTNFGIYKDEVDPSIAKPYARLSLEIKQQFNSWKIITEADPFAIAEMFGNIGGFWDLLLLLWPIFFVAATQQDPQLKARTFKKSVVRGAERAAGITKVIPRPGPIRRASQAGMSDASGGPSLEEGGEERQPWDRSSERQMDATTHHKIISPLPRPQRNVSTRASNGPGVLQPEE